jgi:hypothetical protein
MKSNNYEVVKYNGGEAHCELRGPSAQLITLQGPAARVAIQWLPEDRRVLDVEVRMRVVGTRGFIFGDFPPVVEYSVQLSQGLYVWSEPPINYPVSNDTTFPIANTVLPARGVVFRAPTREMSITLAAPRVLFGGVMPPDHTTIVSVSFAPSSGMFLDVWPKHSMFDFLAPQHNDPSFPIAANEWRVSNFQSGDPMTVGSVTYATLTGGVLGSTALASLADFRPIPVHAFSFRSTDQFDMEFR